VTGFAAPAGARHGVGSRRIRHTGRHASI
jgi:hypothetical protein